MYNDEDPNEHITGGVIAFVGAKLITWLVYAAIAIVVISSLR